MKHLNFEFLYHDVSVGSDFLDMVLFALSFVIHPDCVLVNISLTVQDILQHCRLLYVYNAFPIFFVKTGCSYQGKFPENEFQLL